MLLTYNRQFIQFVVVLKSISSECGQDLSVAKEEEIFDAVQAWAAAASERGEVCAVKPCRICVRIR